jgi:RNA polymerase-interacting CarD/CdnL/TRCF family regulator
MRIRVETALIIRKVIKYDTVTDLLKALSYGARKTSCQVKTFKQTRDQQYGSGVFYVVRAETVAR